MDSSNTLYNLPVRNLNTLICNVNHFTILLDVIHFWKHTFPSVAMTAYSSPLGENITEVGVTLCCKKYDASRACLGSFHGYLGKFIEVCISLVLEFDVVRELVIM